jgi:hypothetical protein
MIYSKLCKMYKKTPNELAELTPTQLLILWSPEKASETLFFETYEDYAEWQTGQRSS